MKTIYVTLALSLAVMAVLVVLSGAWRSTVNKNNTALTTNVMAMEDDKQVMATHGGKETSYETAADTLITKAVTEDFEDEELPVSTEKVIADEPLPDFMTPVSGYVMKGHSGDTPVFSVTMNDYRPHVGVDIYANEGDDVFAAADGVITDVWEDPLSGYCLSITHSGGAVSIYRNIDPTLPENITAGVEVSAGEVVATIGDSSLLEIADEAHLHYELEIDGAAVDPTLYIEFPADDTDYEG